MKIDKLNQYDIFCNLSVDDLKPILPHCELRRYDTGEIIFREGEQATHLFLVKDGQVSLQIKLSENQKVTIFTGTEWQTVGWSILVPPHTLTATCETIKPS